MNKKVISIVLNNFQNDSRVLKENQSLQKAGYDVQVIALWEAGLKVFDVVGGVPVHRVRLVTKHWSNNKLIQLIKYLEFIVRVLKQYRKIDIVHCHDLNALPVGWLMKRLLNRAVKVVYDAHEYETETQGLKGLRKKVIKVLEKRLIYSADAVITVSESIAEAYQRIYKIKKPDIVLNCPLYRSEDKQDLFREYFGLKKHQVIFLYQGRLSQGRGVERLLDAFSSLGSDKAVLVCMGYGPLCDEIVKRAANSANIFFHEAVSTDVLLSYTSSADFGISLIEDSCLSYRYCLPNKMFEYLMADLPVLVSNLIEMQRLVEDYKVGFVIEGESQPELTAAINKCLTSEKNTFQESIMQAKKVFNWENQEAVLINVYQNL
ncbi:glycosyltransferase family 4 protein [Thiomicrorhabdus lithotrophica]|uniref:Glycosyltransferase family 4 protein n=1 Tax=Thiomicrorhabdus lithotrophica TaxID=2949997 RepID=A0ABY8CAY5_9GAMM|nr:glycosyltransferase family 4 protein [Thiomicrorhabdus lithotrophica]WEJ63145.1 glycosyltransferase family 4 protein [Thiomicrorhabdus lithotrophica]